MNYPEVYSEIETIDLALKRSSLARYGDGEFRLCLDGHSVSQENSPELRAELRAILKAPANKRCVVCIPPLNHKRSPKDGHWDKYRAEKYVELLRGGPYGSSFVTRPDNAPWIDTHDYWDRVRRLWDGKQVILVRGDAKSITPERMGGAEILNDIVGPTKHAYAEIDAIESQIGSPTGDNQIVLIALGAAATVLAWRLSQRNIHAVDVGHIGMFMKHKGLFAINPDALCSPEYRKQIVELHATTTWGNSGKSWAEKIEVYAKALGAADVLDYGCGEGSLKKATKDVLKVYEYDPGIPGKDALPKAADLVVATDVLEHVEEEKVDAVLAHMHQLANKGAFVVIALRPARAILPDGRNAHILLRDSNWWIKALRKVGWNMGRSMDTGKMFWAELRK